eukprot:CAMPEP_0185748438 /NCGR_PEP_ID=MMETSP1174-20130828/7125_1 /TAXON_ID=35687 /ORGANISM="Dictyocha speculum, Strain CCMP1381" /LENGTH=91 /DNA_ID=CAMNT_0028424113 /DNA_START=138 /DNA_END=413 /DNA_ORIENTATION=+
MPLAAADEEQTVQDLNLEEMFEVFEAADREIPSEGDTSLQAASQAASPEDAGKENRVILYIALSLAPILFLLPFLSSSELKPLDPSILAGM